MQHNKKERNNRKNIITHPQKKIKNPKLQNKDEKNHNQKEIKNKKNK